MTHDLSGLNKPSPIFMKVIFWGSYEGATILLSRIKRKSYKLPRFYHQKFYFETSKAELLEKYGLVRSILILKTFLLKRHRKK